MEKEIDIKSSSANKSFQTPDKTKRSFHIGIMPNNAIKAREKRKINKRRKKLGDH